MGDLLRISFARDQASPDFARAHERTLLAESPFVNGYESISGESSTSG
jgi:hypothetical protein